MQFPNYDGMFWSDNCGSNIHEFCSPCQCPCHGISLDKKEVKLLTDFLKDEYIHYENPELIKLVRALNEFVDSK